MQLIIAMLLQENLNKGMQELAGAAEMKAMQIVIKGAEITIPIVAIMNKEEIAIIVLVQEMITATAEEMMQTLAETINPTIEVRLMIAMPMEEQAVEIPMELSKEMVMQM